MGGRPAARPSAAHTAARLREGARLRGLHQLSPEEEEEEEKEGRRDTSRRAITLSLSHTHTETHTLTHTQARAHVLQSKLLDSVKVPRLKPRAGEGFLKRGGERVQLQSAPRRSPEPRVGGQVGRFQGSVERLNVCEKMCKRIFYFFGGGGGVFCEAFRKSVYFFGVGGGASLLRDQFIASYGSF